MPRVSRGNAACPSHKVIKAAKGYYGRRKNTFKTAKQAVDKARQYAYRDGRVRKRDFRPLDPADQCRRPDSRYNLFCSLGGLSKAGMKLTVRYLLIWLFMSLRLFLRWWTSQNRRASSGLRLGYLCPNKKPV